MTLKIWTNKVDRDSDFTQGKVTQSSVLIGLNLTGGGLGGVSIIVQFLGTLLGISIAVLGALAVYGAINTSMGLRLSEEDEFNGADLAIHKISSTNED